MKKYGVDKTGHFLNHRKTDT